jgi:hypothetical protein
VVFFSGYPLKPGAEVRVRYRKAHTIEDLNDASQTTVPPADRLFVVQYAAADMLVDLLPGLLLNPLPFHHSDPCLLATLQHWLAELGRHMKAVQGGNGLKWYV